MSMWVGESLVFSVILRGKFLFRVQEQGLEKAQWQGQPGYGSRTQCATSPSSSHSCRHSHPRRTTALGTRGVPGEQSSQATLEVLDLPSNERSGSTEVKGGKEFCGFHPCLVYRQSSQIVWQQLGKPGEGSCRSGAAGGSRLVLAETCK